MLIAFDLKEGVKEVMQVGLRKEWVELLVTVRVHHFGVTLS